MGPTPPIEADFSDEAPFSEAVPLTAALHVTNGGVNPVLTILALAWRVAERLADELA